MPGAFYSSGIADEIGGNFTIGGELLIGTAAGELPRTIRLLEATTSGFQGGFVQYDGAANTMIVGVHNLVDSNTANDLDVITINRTSGVATFSNSIELTAGGPTINVGSGTPEAAVAADVGSTFHRTDGGAGTSFYVKESGTGNTGWAAK